MEKLTNWEKKLIAGGVSIITWDQEVIIRYLSLVFERDRDALLLEAVSDTTNRKELGFILDFENRYKSDRRNNFGGMVFYNTKRRKFTHISYSDKNNYSVSFSIESRVVYSAYDFYRSIYKIFPFGVSVKRGAEYFRTH